MIASLQETSLTVPGCAQKDISNLSRDRLTHRGRQAMTYFLKRKLQKIALIPGRLSRK
jgi:hypothetical protein